MGYLLLLENQLLGKNWANLSNFCFTTREVIIKLFIIDFIFLAHLHFDILGLNVKGPGDEGLSFYEGAKVR